jgi:hypothetical protein
MNILAENTTQGRIERANVVNAIFGNIEELFVNLYSRWQDEKEYEDFNDYTTRLMEEVVKHSPKDTKLVKGNKRPFGITISIPHFPYNVKISIKRNQYTWETV